jgi:hypothetical protein
LVSDTVIKTKMDIVAKEKELGVLPQ